MSFLFVPLAQKRGQANDLMRLVPFELVKVPWRMPGLLLIFLGTKTQTEKNLAFLFVVTANA